MTDADIINIAVDLAWKAITSLPREARRDVINALVELDNRQTLREKLTEIVREGEELVLSVRAARGGVEPRSSWVCNVCETLVYNGEDRAALDAALLAHASVCLTRRVL